MHANHKHVYTFKWNLNDAKYCFHHVYCTLFCSITYLKCHCSFNFFLSLVCVTFTKSYKSQWMLTPIQIFKTTKTRKISIQITSCSVSLVILAFILKISKRINLDENTKCESQLDLLPFHLFSSDVIFCYDAEPTFNSLLSKPVLRVIFFLNLFVPIVDENKSCFKRKKTLIIIIIEISFINHLLNCDELLSSFNLMLCQFISVVVLKKTSHKSICESKSKYCLSTKIHIFFISSMCTLHFILNNTKTICHWFVTFPLNTIKKYIANRSKL